MIESYFNINYEFDKQAVREFIDKAIADKKAGYITVADGNVVGFAQKHDDYIKVLNEAFFAICDSGWVPVYLKWIYGIHREQYCGPMIFKDLVSQGKHRMFFMGTKQETLDSLQSELAKMNPDVKDMSFYELPFRKVEEFDYPAIAKKIEADGADLIWVALGAPKQDYFMNRLKPYLKKGVMIGVGAAFNFYSGMGEKRAPQWVIDYHIEFLYRIKQAPKKQIKRCWMIIKGMPSLLWGEWRRKKTHQSFRGVLM